MNAKKRRRRLQQEPYTFTPAQLQMREDLIGGASKAFAKKLDTQLLQAMDQADQEDGTTRLSDALDNIWLRPAQVGLKADAAAVEEVALSIIDEDGAGLVLNFAQWAQVQGMLQAGIRAGIDIGRSLPSE
jgi:hypothetical protein